MPNCLFHHLFKQSLHKAVTQLKTVCSEEKSSEHQNQFNIDSQIPLMTEIFENISAINPDDLSLNWAEYRVNISTIIEEAKEKAETEKNTKQACCGSTISIDQTTAFCNKLLRMYDEMRLQITEPLFNPHGNMAASMYTNTDYSKSPHLNQLIYIALEYRFNKIQGKIVADVVDYTDKHKSKWKALTETIRLWELKIELSRTNTTQQELMERDIKALLNQLISDESCIQNEVKPVSQNTTFSIFKSYAKTTLTYFLENEGSLRLSLERLLSSYLTTSQYASAIEEEDTKKTRTTQKTAGMH